MGKIVTHTTSNTKPQVMRDQQLYRGQGVLACTQQIPTQHTSHTTSIHIHTPTEGDRAEAGVASLLPHGSRFKKKGGKRVVLDKAGKVMTAGAVQEGSLAVVRSGGEQGAGLCLIETRQTHVLQRRGGPPHCASSQSARAARSSSRAPPRFRDCGTR